MLQIDQLERHVLAYIAAGAKVDWEKERARFDADLAARPVVDPQALIVRQLGLVS